ncbi:uncharacterized protein CLUP02_01835 [Colletotrichum lupini]|uniref:Uncharacterized protein n=1 Tax=Colletotrichum lupini TaxID=145971 RepID=A0A9Q8SES5_9PEZI|nr:uncharacterized protein CLUP02_01835 [Colletotrichum lupini]UQC75182.1 hypothetical protein CLUP02_01835 [Colletotrichum lupini]
MLSPSLPSEEDIESEENIEAWWYGEVDVFLAAVTKTTVIVLNPCADFILNAELLTALRKSDKSVLFATVFVSLSSLWAIIAGLACCRSRVAGDVGAARAEMLLSGVRIGQRPFPMRTRHAPGLEHRKITSESESWVGGDVLVDATDIGNVFVADADVLYAVGLEPRQITSS